ncbi:MAG TPA: hypothetical protein VIH57_16275 [Bacteroidales bacterium]
MKKQTEPIETLSEIRSIMERSTRFISLNGFAGVFAGIFALVGAFAAYLNFRTNLIHPHYYDYATTSEGIPNLSFYIFFFTDAFLVLIASIVVAVYLSVRKSAKKGLKAWDNSAKRVIYNMSVPLVGGGLFCILIVYHGYIGLVIPVTLIFYGLALISTSKYTFDDIRYLGICELIVGLMATLWIDYGLLFWAFGFGVIHIVYGIIMYYKYER